MLELLLYSKICGVEYLSNHENLLQEIDKQHRINFKRAREPLFAIGGT